LTVRDLMGTPTRIPVEYKRLPESVSPGDLIFLNDGFMQLPVEKVSGGEVFCRTVIGGPLLTHKGLSIPGIKIVADAVSKADLEFVAFARQQGKDESVIWVEDESPDDRLEALSMQIIKA